MILRGKNMGARPNADTDFVVIINADKAGNPLVLRSLRYPGLKITSGREMEKHLLTQSGMLPTLLLVVSRVCHLRWR